MKVQECKTIHDIHNLRWGHILPNTHIIIGPNGQCLCGIYDGVEVRCYDLIITLHPETVRSNVEMESGDGSDY